MSADAFSGLVSSVQYMNQQKARHRQARHENLVQAGEDLVFNTLLECLPEDHPMRHETVRQQISYMGRVAHLEGRAPALPVDPGAILSELQEKHRSAVRRATEELEDQQPTERGVIFKHWSCASTVNPFA